MDIANVRAEIESERTWRQEELRILHNHLSHLRSDTEKDQYRKALVVMLYAHLEGFCKLAFTAYVNAINKEALSCEEVTDALMVAGLSNILTSLTDSSRKCDFFRRALPDDTEVHLFARQAEFLGRLKEAFGRTLSIPVDKVIDTESNLKPVVLRKILFRLGFPHDLLRTSEGDLHRLLNCRNNIAHGMSKFGVTSKEYQELRDCAYDVMDGVTRCITRAMRENQYRNSAPRRHDTSAGEH